jgi:hypothetical protein
MTKIVKIVLFVALTALMAFGTNPGFTDPMTAANGSAANASYWSAVASSGSLTAGTTNDIQSNRYRFHGGAATGQVQTVLKTSVWIDLSTTNAVPPTFTFDLDTSSWPSTSGAVLVVAGLAGETHTSNGIGSPTDNAFGFYLFSTSTPSYNTFLVNSGGSETDTPVTTVANGSYTWKMVLNGSTFTIYRNGSVMSTTTTTGISWGTKVQFFVKMIYSANTLTDTFLDNVAAVTPVVPVLKDAGNPILSPSVTSGDQDFAAVRDTTFLKTCSTYNIGYTGFRSTSQSANWAEIMLATSSAWNGPYTKQGVIVDVHSGAAQADSRVSTDGVGDPFFIFDSSSSTWHLWISVEPTTPATYGTRTVGHLTASGTSCSIPTSGWTWDTPYAVVGSTTGWTGATVAGHTAGVAAPKVFPAVGGGYIMFIQSWGNLPETYHTTDFRCGYATAPSLNGPWTLGSQLIGVDGGYQGEQCPYYSYFGGKHYLFVNRLALNGNPTIGGPGTWGLYIDVWSADAQTGPYSIFQYDVTGKDYLPSGSGWERSGGDQGVTSFINDTGTFRAVYDANTSGFAIGRSIGAFTFTLPAPAVSGGSTMSSD